MTGPSVFVLEVGLREVGPQESERLVPDVRARRGIKSLTLIVEERVVRAFVHVELNLLSTVLERLFEFATTVAFIASVCSQNGGVHAVKQVQRLR